ncbi:hypothetical protein [Flavivirga eckloniae]|uniref:Uncharacterized protein n=1 Tax=Flavivirga eckloniae TaxID=1803846 RepID=A0A2K9PQ89_9FLAO|nr:hypothetical protein [Flavivirga eckloniae]AUP79231.1 hypothetical protein C1H87_11155 [Flavivirga eckloniae]
MDTILGLLIVILFITGFIFALRHIVFPKHDFSGDLEKEKESYEYLMSEFYNSFLEFIDEIKSLFR